MKNMNRKTIIIVGILALIVGFVIGYAVKPAIPIGGEVFFPKITFKEGIKVEKDASFGGGTDVDKVYHASGSVDLPSITATTTDSAILSVTGATTDMKCFLMPPSGIDDDLIPKGCAVTAANTVTIYVFNDSAGAIDDIARIYQVLLLK